MNFPNISDKLYLNFINTRIIKNSKKRELIGDEYHLRDWLAYISKNHEAYHHEISICQQLLSEIDDKQAYVNELITFREELYRQLDAIIHGSSVDSFIQEIEKNINTLEPKVICLDKKILLLPQSETFINGFRMFIFLDILDSFSRGDFGKLSHCHNHECILLFINKTGRRKWCSMEICGNRNKVKNFHNKRK